MTSRLPQQATRLARFVQDAASHSGAIWISRVTEAQQEPARRADVENGELEGLLVAVKDNIDVAGFPTTAACPAFSYQPQLSAAVVTRLLDQGASVVGKTNMDQFACGLVGTRSPYGEVPNAINPDYVSGGSSSGSAVAVSLGLVDVALGTDTAGSGRIPAALNNIVGIKPSRGLLSLRGTVSACRHLDCISIFARTVPLAMQVLALAAGHDALDVYSRKVELDPRYLPERPRIAIADARHLEFFGDTHSRRAFDSALELVRSRDCTLVPMDLAAVVRAGAALYEDAWVAERYTAIAKFFDGHEKDIDPVVRTIIESGKRFSASDVFLAMERLASYRQATQSFWRDVDFLLVPSAPTFPTRAAVREEPLLRNHELGYYTNFVNLLDLAAIAVPATLRDDGLPFGITLIGPAGSELRLADFANRVQQANGLALGALSEACPRTTGEPFVRAKKSTVRVVVVGAHLSGFPLNVQLLERGARLIATRRTAARYRLLRLPQAEPAKPGLVRVSGNQPGRAIEVEVWELPASSYGSFVAAIERPLGIAPIELDDGQWLQGFLCDGDALTSAEDISQFGGWRAYQQATARQS
jgi:allophanate hydrolase